MNSHLTSALALQAQLDTANETVRKLRSENLQLKQRLELANELTNRDMPCAKAIND